MRPINAMNKTALRSSWRACSTRLPLRFARYGGHVTRQGRRHCLVCVADFVEPLRHRNGRVVGRFGA